MYNHRHVIAIVNPKGGTGKTTLALNLAAGLALENCDVEALDADSKQKALWKHSIRANQLFSTRILVEMSHYSSLSEKYSVSTAHSSQEKYLIIDTGSNTESDLLESIFIDSDLVLTPFPADITNLDALESFFEHTVQTLKHNPDLKIRLLPRESYPQDLAFFEVLGYFQSSLMPSLQEKGLNLEIWPLMAQYSPLFMEALQQRGSIFTLSTPTAEKDKHAMKGITLYVREEIRRAFEEDTQ